MTWIFVCQQEYCFTPATLWFSLLGLLFLTIVTLILRIHQLISLRKRSRQRKKQKDPPSNGAATGSKKNDPNSPTPLRVLSERMQRQDDEGAR